MSSRTPSTADVLNEWFRSRQIDVRVAIPGQVESYDPSKQTADIKPLVRDILIDADGGTITESLPVLPNVRVLHPRGGGFFAALPLKKGDFVQLLVNDRSLDQWRAKGTEGDPVDLRMHDLSDAVAIPAGYPDTQPLADAEADKLVIGKEGGPYACFDGTVVNIGDKAAEAFIARADKVDARISALEQAFIAHVHPTALGPSGTIVPTFTPGSSTAATKGKVT